MRSRGPQVAGVPAVLRALRAHQGRLHAALAFLPGGPIFTNASLAARTVQAAANAPDLGQESDDGGGCGTRWNQQPASLSGSGEAPRHQEHGQARQAIAQPRTPQPQPRPVSQGGYAVGCSGGPGPPRGTDMSPTRSLAAQRLAPTNAPPAASPPEPQQRQQQQQQQQQPPFAVPPLKLPGAGGSAALPPWIPPPVPEEDPREGPDEVESLHSVPPAAAGPAANRAESDSSPRAATAGTAAGTAGGQGSASPSGASNGRQLSGRVENCSKYDVMRSRQQQHQPALAVPFSVAPDHMQGSVGSSGHAAREAAAAGPVLGTAGADAVLIAAAPVDDDSWAELGVEEVDEDLDGDY
mgnify:CR=1 FL=1